MKNILGHDNDSEIITIIARLKENKFKVLQSNTKQIVFEIVLKYIYAVPVPFTHTKTIEYVITREHDVVDYPLREGNKLSSVPLLPYKFYIKQKNGIDIREISLQDGYIMWALLNAKL
jgi:hypothetical protein